MDYTALAHAGVVFLTPYLAKAAGKLVDTGLDAGREQLWNWLKGKFTKPAQSGALQLAAKTPDDAEALDALRYQLERALQQDAAFRKELEELLPREVVKAAQNMSISGNNNVGVQNAGGGSVNIRR
jgi:hypothetical protein